MPAGLEAMLRGLGLGRGESAKAEGGSSPVAAALPAADTTFPLVVGPGTAADFGRG